MSSSRCEGRSPGSARTVTYSRRCRSVPPSRSTACDSPTGCTGTSTLSSSVIFTTKKSTCCGTRFTGCSWTLWRSTGVALPPLIARSSSVLRGRHAGAPSRTHAHPAGWPATRAMAVDDGGEDALAAQAADGLADDLARLCRHERTGAHGREPLSGWRDLRLRCGASLTARGRDLRDRLTCLGRCGW